MISAIHRQRRTVTTLRWVMFIALAYLTTAGGASVLQLALLAIVAASNVALSRVSDRLWEHEALLPTIAGLDTVVLVSAMLWGTGFARDFFFAYFALLAVVALAGGLRAAIVGTSIAVASYGTLLGLEQGAGFLQDPDLIGRLGFLFSVGVGYGGLLEASRTRMREAALQGQLVGWVGKLSAAFSDDFDAAEVIRQVLRDTQNSYPGTVRASLVQLENGALRVICSSDDQSVGEFELDPARYPELLEATSRDEPIIIDDIRNDPLMASVQEFNEAPFTGLLLCPVNLRQADAGHIILRVARKGGTFSPSIVTTTQHVAEAIGVIFRQAKMREAVERSEKVEMVSQVTGSVAHSFNGILSTVLLASRTLRRASEQHARTAGCYSAPCGSDAAKRFDAIEQAAKDGLTIVERLGAWTNVDQHARGGLTVGAIDPRALLEEVWRYAEPIWVKRSHTRSLNVEWRCDEVAAVAGSSAELREVLLNLVVNAIDAMPRGGTLTLGLRVAEPDVVFAVADTGTGIPDAIIARIFEPLFSTKGSGGKGLGLSLARSVAERHRGTLTVTSKEGVGSTFELRLPAAPELNVELQGDEDAAPAPAGHANGERMLLVEPSELVSDVMVRVLQSSGLEVDVVAELQDAEVMIEARSTYAGILIDAAADQHRAESFLTMLHQNSPSLARRVVFYDNGELPPALLDLQASFGFRCLDRSAGLAALRKVLNDLSEHRDAA